MVRAAAEGGAFRSGVRDCSHETIFEDVPVIFDCQEPQSRTRCGASSQAVPQHPRLLPPRSAVCAPSSWGDAHIVGSAESCTNVRGSEAQRSSLGFSHAVTDNFNFQAAQSVSSSAMPQQPRGQGHVGMVTPSSVNFAGMDFQQEHLNASTLRAASGSSTHSTATARAAQSSFTPFQSGGQRHVGMVAPYSVNSAGMEIVMEHLDAHAHFATSRTTAESTVPPMASPSNATSIRFDGGSVGESSLLVHSVVAGMHFGTSSSAFSAVPGMHFAAHSPQPPQGFVHLRSEHEPPDLQARGPSLASLQWSAEQVAQGRGEEQFQMPATAANPTNLGSRVHHTGSCTPCKFFRSRRGCKEEDRCMLCHYPHPEMTYSKMQRNMKQRSQEKRQLAREARLITSLTPMNMESVMAV